MPFLTSDGQLYAHASLHTYLNFSTYTSSKKKIHLKGVILYRYDNDYQYIYIHLY